MSGVLPTEMGLVRAGATVATSFVATFGLGNFTQDAIEGYTLTIAVAEVAYASFYMMARAVGYNHDSASLTAASLVICAAAKYIMCKHGPHQNKIDFLTAVTLHILSRNVAGYWFPDPVPKDVKSFV